MDHPTPDRRHRRGSSTELTRGPSGRLEAARHPDDVLGAVTTPTGMGLHGLVRHLTNVERSWLRDVFAGEEGLVFDWTEQDPDAEWRILRV